MKAPDQSTRQHAQATGDAHSPNAAIVAYYSSAGMDYEPWSAALNMHFGFYRWPAKPWHREQLLRQMNVEVLRRLAPVQAPCIVDLGCGVGTVARYMLGQIHRAHITATTIVPWQIDQARLRTSPQEAQYIEYILDDFTASKLPQNSFDAAYAIESSCYASGLDKRDFLATAYRLLKPGGRLVIADGFRRRSRGSQFFEFCFRGTCAGWALDTFAGIHPFCCAARELGFAVCNVENITWRLVPSVLHVPWVSLKFWWQSLRGRSGERQTQNIRKNHLKAPMLGLLTGLHLHQYGYYLVTLEKPGGEAQPPTEASHHPIS